MSDFNARVENSIANLVGNKDAFCEMVIDKDAILRSVCDYAEYVAKQKGCEPWSIMGRITGHGSGVSSALYEIYRRRKDDKAS